ncbi:MAG TPA: MBL fold metallo-hydrolase [Chthoniobacterales bacterium]
MSIPLEDGYTDIIAKAQRGSGIADSQLAAKSGVSLEDVKVLKSGKISEPVILAVAEALHLKPTALLALATGKYRPDVAEPEGLAMFTTPYSDMTVNAYLVWDAATKEAVAFDSGADATAMLHFIVSNGLRLTAVLLTHSHGDHVFDLDRLTEKTGAAAFVPEQESVPGATPFAQGRTFRAGKLKIASVLTNGHSLGGTTYVVDGLAVPVAVVGDSMFAGSMGGAANAYQLALRNNLEKILSLRPETVICPGHGPLTTVALERENNPFF